MIDLSKFTIKAKVNKPKPKHNSKREYNVQLTKLVNGKVILEDGIYKCIINYDDIVNKLGKFITIDMITKIPYKPIIVSFTNDSYDLYRRPVIFTKSLLKGEYICIIRDYTRMLTYPGDSNRFIPFALNWIVRGWLVDINGEQQFKFRNCVTINGMDARDSVFNIKKQIEDEEIKWKLKKEK